jgi:hypothetical protein
MAVTLSNNDNYRYERKFIVSEISEYEIETMIKLHPAMFFEVYPQRHINNLYFDSFALKNYLDSVDGFKDRIKIRIRWYGDLFGIIERPRLEIKIKNGLVGKKESYLLNPFSFDENLKRNAILDVLKKSEIPEQLKLKLNSSEFALLNRYIRRYYESMDRRFRLTIDSEMTFYKLNAHHNNFLHKSYDQINTIVELKYGPDEDSYIERISNNFPFRMTKSSKYVDGIERLYF